MITEKKCYGYCKTVKPLSEFNKDSGRNDGCTVICRECSRKKYKKYYEKNSQKVILSQKRRSNSLTEEQKQRKIEYHKKHWAKNKDKFNAIKRQRRLDNSEEIHRREREYRKQYNSNPVRRLARNLRRGFHHALKHGIKSKSVLKLIGCSLEELKLYIESLFLPEMTWANWGPARRGKKHWHIDHILPVDSFDMMKLEDQQKCWHYSNLRPLWWEDNLAKSNKIIV